jgi:hypothetical protein
MPGTHLARTPVALLFIPSALDRPVRGSGLSCSEPGRHDSNVVCTINVNGQSEHLAASIDQEGVGMITYARLANSHQRARGAGLKKKLAIGVVVALFAWSLPGAASAVIATTYGSASENYSGWQGVRVSGTNCDSHDVYSDYKRDSGTPQSFYNSQGCNTSEETGTSTNLIARFNSCVDDAGPNTCSVTKTR